MRRLVVVLALLLVGIAVLPAEAFHALGPHWSRRSNPFVVYLVDGMTAYHAELQQVAAEWSTSSVVDVVVSSSCDRKQRCIYTTNGESTNGIAGNTQLGYTPEGHITSTAIWLNDTIIATQPDGYALNVLCTESGHALGLDHSDSIDSSMKAQGYATSPDAHDLEELSIIYEHIDRGGN